jgi:peptidoglycan/xylan/chitin deacetylase (PgdA/CDA1 family)
MAGRRGAPAVAAVLLVLTLVCLTQVVGLSPVAGADPAATGARASQPGRCSAGLVALTFDDGPAPGVTPGLVRTLRDLGVPATFFMVGERVASAPATARLVARNGFQVANHSYHHALMTSQSSDAIRATLRATARQLRAAGVRPSGLMRPPYGGIDDRVRAAIASVGLLPVLWDVDSRDWEGGSSAAIAAGVLGQLRPHRRNIVLQHDGVTNSPASVGAVPTIVRKARARGYCFASLGPDGIPAAPVPRATSRPVAVAEGENARLVVRQDRPTSRPTWVLLTSEGGSAQSGHDYRAFRQWLRFPVGTTRAAMALPVWNDGLDEPDERIWIRLSHPNGVHLVTRAVAVTIRDTNEPPGLALSGARVIEPDTGTATADVRVRLGRPSGRWVKVTLTTRPGSAVEGDFDPVTRTLSFPPGATERSFPVRVLADSEIEPAEWFTVVVTGASHARIVRGSAAVAIDPPTPP